MQDHEAMDAQVPYEILEVKSKDGKVVKKIGLVAVLSNDPKLYQHFPKPGAFGGATIKDPWDTLTYYKKYLEETCGCDLVIPLEHMYVPENKKTCENFDFPVILSGHDHHRIDQVINGTRLIKPGMDGEHCTVLEVIFKKGEAKPTIRSSFVDVSKWNPNVELKEKTDRAYDVLLPLRNTELAGILPQYEPLTSKDARGSTCTMGKLICSMLKSSLDQTQKTPVDAVVLMGGNIRGGEDYEPGSFFSLEMLEAEIKSDEVVGVVECPGDVLARGIEATHVEGTPRPGWFQYDDGVVEAKCEDGIHYRVTHIGGKPLDRSKMYRIATKISDLTNGQSPPLKEYFLLHQDALPSKGDYINIQSQLMGFFSRNLFRKLWDITGERMAMSSPVASSRKSSIDVTFQASTHEDADEEDDGSGDVGSDDGALASVDESRLRLDVLDRDGDGIVDVSDIHYALEKYLGLSVHGKEQTLAKAVHSHADTTGDGTVTVDDFEVFCTGMPKEYKPIPKWANAFRKPSFAEISATEQEDSDSDLEVDL